MNRSINTAYYEAHPTFYLEKNSIYRQFRFIILSTTKLISAVVYRLSNERNSTTLLFLPLFFLLFTPKPASAQMMDSIRLSFKQKARFVIGFDSRNSFISNERAEILGLKLGVEFGNKFGIGLSGHLMNETNSHFYKNYTVVSPTGSNEIVKAQLKLFYIAYYVEYIFYNSKHWKFSVPLQLGIGRSNYLYTYNNKEEAPDKHIVLIYEPIVATEYRIFKWLSVTGEIGYRVMLLNNPTVKENFNSPTYAVGIGISFSELCKIFFPESKLTKLMNKG